VSAALLWTLVSLGPVRAFGAVFFFRGIELEREERMMYVGYRRRALDGLVCGSRFNDEIGRQRTASFRENAKFWSSLHALRRMVDLNVPSQGRRLVDVSNGRVKGRGRPPLYLLSSEFLSVSRFSRIKRV